MKRIDLLQKWHNHIHDEYQDPSRAQKHLDDKPRSNIYEIIDDDCLTELGDLMAERSRLASRYSKPLEQIAALGVAINSMKDVVADRHNKSVTNGRVSVQVIHRKQSVDWKKAFEAVDGYKDLESMDKTIEDFHREGNTRQVKVHDQGDL